MKNELDCLNPIPHPLIAIAILSILTELYSKQKGLKFVETELNKSSPAITTPGE